MPQRVLFHTKYRFSRKETSGTQQKRGTLACTVSDGEGSLKTRLTMRTQALATQSNCRLMNSRENFSVEFQKNQPLLKIYSKNKNPKATKTMHRPETQPISSPASQDCLTVPLHLNGYMTLLYFTFLSTQTSSSLRVFFSLGSSPHCTKCQHEITSAPGLCRSPHIPSLMVSQPSTLTVSLVKVKFCS